MTAVFVTPMAATAPPAPPAPRHPLAPVVRHGLAPQPARRDHTLALAATLLLVAIVLTLGVSMERGNPVATTASAAPQVPSPSISVAPTTGTPVSATVSS